MLDEISSKLIRDYGADDADLIIEDFLDYISGIQDEQELRDTLMSLYNKGYIIGFKKALIERIGTDVQTLDFIQGRIF